MTKTIRVSLTYLIIAPSLTGAVIAAHAQSPLMSAEWAQQACEAWNAEPELTDKLVESGWVSNDKDRGYKVMHVYRTDCPDSPRVELRVSLQDGKATCVYGGAVEKDPDTDVDYIMHAETRRWKEMGAGDYGPMWAMTTRRLKFSGPKWEAMKNMGPFGQFLRLPGKIPSDTESCP